MKPRLSTSYSRSQREEAPYRLTPGRTMLLLLMGGSFMMFLFLLVNMVVYSLRQGSSRLQLPETFVVSTWVLLITSFILRRTRDHLQSEALKPALYHLNAALASLLSFIGLQMVAWFTLLKQLDLETTPRTLVHYVYFVTGMHMVHVLVALGMVASFWLNFFKRRRDPVAELILFTDPTLVRRFQNTEWFCHYTDGVWILIFISLLIV
ncbi:MAG: hypothetical protein N2110_03565 [Flavobacteriales bacterium]|nr:hypothetical protein [Flavobacteriales bacterium]MCX7768087.1 hypothetical protein [Flavobacteriales bacterium]MDW8410347.1 hypothetical protein [Flavobacteriales bacterium]